MTAAALEEALIALVRAAPELAPADVEAAAGGALVLATTLVATPPLARLALTIERVLDGIADGLIAQGVALPALAMAADTLHRGVRRGAGDAASEAARFELDTLLPLPGAVATGGPDVALGRLAPSLAPPPAGAAARAARRAALSADARHHLAALGDA